MKIFLLQVMMALCLASTVSARELNDVKLADQIKVDSLELHLNGMGLRTVVKFGFTVKVYVAGLYLENKASDSDAIVKNNEVKYLVMHFVRPVDREALIEGFSASYEDACIVECTEQKKQFGIFSKEVVSVRKDNEIRLTFYKDKIKIESTGPNARAAVIENAALSRNMLSVFINKNKNPGVDFRKGLLGL